MKDHYDPTAVEESAQAYWENQHCFDVKEDLSKEKFYCLSMLPYPSGELHMGHVRNYTIGDVIARYHRQLGQNVLQPMGWDAFGLPAENAAIQRQTSPSNWTEKNIKRMRKQFKQMGYAIDWSRELTTCEPDYYRWEQWLFLKLYQKGLAYKKSALVNWDPVDQTVLANEQVVDGKGWRSGADIERRQIDQWFLKITDYADELLAGLDDLTGWPEQVVAMQRNWIGRSYGVSIQFKVQKQSQALEVFTTRPDTLMGATYLAIAIQHPLAQQAATKDTKIKTFIKNISKISVAEAETAKQKKQGIFSGYYAIHPVSQKKIPIWITNFVLMDYGSGAVMSVPAHDERDHEFAKLYDLPITPVIQPVDHESWDYNSQAFTEEGILINSEQFTGLASAEAFDVIADFLKSHTIGSKKTHFRLRDWGISRQRYWGTPIPIIYCKHCGTVPVPEADLPVTLPKEIVPDGHGSPLAHTPEFYKVKCPACGKAAKRETDTMDTFVESSWYYARYCSVDQHNAMLDDRAKYWTPVDQYIGGIEHAVMHLLYARFIHKVLRDEGLVNSNEPFLRLLTQGMVLKDGSKMSKSKGNIVAPQALIKKYGADTARLFVLFAAPPEQSLEWSDSGVDGAFRFLRKLWLFAYEVATPIIAINQDHFTKQEDTQTQILARKNLHDYLQQANHDIEKHQFNTVVSAGMKILNLLSKLNQKDEGDLRLVHEGLSILLRLLHPITPHITHELWQQLAYGDNIIESGWPKANIKAMQSNEIKLVVQVNGRLRAHIQVATNASNEDIENTALNEDNIQRHVADKKIKKIVIVPNKLVNIVV